jgi:hypothetical protein
MRHSSLASTNRYLKDPTLRKKLVVRSVATSSAIEGIRAPFKGKAAKARTQARAKKR